MSGIFCVNLNDTACKDSYRLPEGMKRIGYDADNKCYYFRDRDGQAWEGNPGEEYGTMHKLVSPPPSARAMFESGMFISYSPG